MKRHVFLYVAVFSLGVLLVNKVQGEESCCENGDVIDDHDSCKNKTRILSHCDGYNLLLNNEWSTYSHYIIKKDRLGEYLDAYGMGYLIREPFFCTGRMKRVYLNKTSTVAIICSSKRIRYSEIKDYEGVNYSDTMLNISMGAFYVLDILSAISLTLTSIIYFILPQTQDVEGKCTFNLTLNLGLFHILAFYLTYFKSNGLLPNLCITNLYIATFVGLSAFTWTLVNTYHMWNRLRTNVALNDEQLMKRYRIIGYGIPAILVSLSNIHAHLNSLYTENSFELSCYRHQSIMIFLYTLLPILAIELANGFFFFDLQRRLWNVQPVNLRGENTSKIKKINYRLKLNGKLFALLGFPWILFFLLIFLYFLSSFKAILFLIWVNILIISAEGIFIFFITVFNRKRVNRALLNKFEINVLPKKWRPSNDSEESAEDNMDYESDEGEFSANAPKNSPENGVSLTIN